MACVAKGTPLSVRMARQAVRAKGALEDGAREHGLRREEPVAAEEEARVLVGDRERIAVAPIARTELPLEVGGPEIVWRRGRDRHHARMLMRVPPASAAHEAAPGEELGRRTRGGPILDFRMAVAEYTEQLPRAPVGMEPVKLAEKLRQDGPDGGGAGVRAPAAISESASPILGKTGDPLVVTCSRCAGSRCSARTAPPS